MEVDIEKIRKEAFGAGHAYAWSERVIGKPTNWMNLYNEWKKEIEFKNNVVLADVSKQRELLIAYETWKVENDIKNLLPDQLADFYIYESNL